MSNNSKVIVCTEYNKTEDIRQFLHHLEQTKCYKVKLQFADTAGNLMAFDVDIEKLDINPDVELFTYCGRILDEISHNYLEESLHEGKISNEFYHDHIDDSHKLLELFITESDLNYYLYQYTYQRIALMDAHENAISIHYRPCSQYIDKCSLSFSALKQNRFTEYPILGNIYLMSPNKFSYYSSNEEPVYDFEMWLKFKQKNQEQSFEEWFDKEYEPL
jgi:hypothetical protein